MRAVITTLMMAAASLAVHAQQIWTEGTTWEIHTETDYCGETKTAVYTYELGEPVSFNDTLYYTLTETHNDKTHIMSYLRAEGDDAYVYARHFQSEELMINTGEQSEILLYDFSKPFEYGDIIRFGTYDGNIGYYYIDPDSPDELRYFYDVIDPGDCLPAYHDIIYKIGAINGPIAHLFGDFVESDANAPDTKNVSHVLFKTKGKPNGSMITLRINVVHYNRQSLSCYWLTGLRCSNADDHMIFKKDNVLLKR